MQNAWLQLLDRVLRPQRPELERCLLERERHLEALRVTAEQRARTIASCEQRIEDARTQIFAANDGVVSSRMTTLEREWRRLSRRDPDQGLMDLWARIARAAWIDRKPWRDSAPAAQLDAAVALGADRENLAAAERAVDALRSALAVFGVPVGARIRWAWFERDAECVGALLAEPQRAAREACPAALRPLIIERARRFAHSVHEAALTRFPERPALASDIAHAALVDLLWREARLDERANPASALAALWSTGYVLSEVDAASVRLEIPAL